MKYTLQEARRILGVTKASSKDEIEKKYDVILKKYRIMKLEGNLSEASEAEFQKSTDAYRIIMGYEVEEPKVAKKETYTDKAFEKVGIDRKKADNFFHYYKYHILIGIVSAIIIALTVRSIVTKVEPDISIGLMGEINYEVQEGFKDKISKNVPEINEISLDTVVLTDRYNNEQAYAYLQKAMVLLAASDIDMFLVNRYAFDTYAINGAFMPLDQIIKDNNIDIPESKAIKLRVVDEWEEPASATDTQRRPKAYVDAEPKLYGIDVTDNEFFKDMNVIGPEKILVVRVEPKHYDLVLKLIKLFTK